MTDSRDTLFNPQLIKRFDVNGTRYTSYPTADRFVEAFNADAYKHWLGRRAVGGINKPLSLYFHIPFCNTICYYCACNKIITKDHGRSAKYLKYMAKEIELRPPALTAGATCCNCTWVAARRHSCRTMKCVSSWAPYAVLQSGSERRILHRGRPQKGGLSRRSRCWVNWASTV